MLLRPLHSWISQPLKVLRNTRCRICTHCLSSSLAALLLSYLPSYLDAIALQYLARTEAIWLKVRGDLLPDKMGLDNHLPQWEAYRGSGVEV
jgi:hypothetical protein